MPLAAPAPARIGEGLRAFIFTMDSLAGYVAGARSGGAAGELIVREGLTWALGELGFAVDVADSDEAMEALAGAGAARYALFFFDPWTLTDRSSRLRAFLRGRERDVFVLSFFDWAPGAASAELGAAIAQRRVLTAYPCESGSSFLGFVVEPNAQALADRAAGQRKRASGVVWGKRHEYLAGREAMLAALATQVQLHFVVARGDAAAAALAQAQSSQAVFHGAVNRDEWRSLLADARFLLGLGNPLLGPSAMDALAAGAMYLDPTYDGAGTRPLVPMQASFGSQHPFLRKHVGEPRVCAIADVTRLEDVLACVRRALETDLEPFVHEDFTRPRLLARVAEIVGARGA